MPSCDAVPTRPRLHTVTLTSVCVAVFHGKEFKGQSLIVQFARSNNHHTGNRREFPPSGPGGFPRPRRTQFRMNISGLPPDTSWQVGLPSFLVSAARYISFDSRGLPEVLR